MTSEGAGSPIEVEDPAPLDLDQVLREIEDDVRARRASGAIPPGLERELDLIFARFAPATASADDLEGVLRAAEAAAIVDVDVPTASRLPGIAPVKRTLRKLTEWYLIYLAQQVSAFGTATVAALKLVHRRVEALERATPGANRGVLDEAGRSASVAEIGAFERVVSDLLADATGRVLMAECGDGAFLARLVEQGIDAYGVDPHVHLAERAAGSGLDARTAEVLAHLRAVGEEALGGLVLCGCVDRLPLGAQLELADLAGAALADGGRIAVVGATPAAWSRTTNVVEADLAPGRPLHGATWAELLARRGVRSIQCHDGPAIGVLERVPDDEAGAAPANANLDRIEEALFGPASFAVTGIRSR